MNRPIKFRAIRTDSLERYGKLMFVEGYLVKTPITAEFNLDPKNGAFFDSGGKGRYCIVSNSGVAHEIDIETVEQFTGLLDKNRKEIYEGDLVLFGDNDIHEGTHGEVIWTQSRGFIYKFIDGQYKGNCTDMVDTWRTYEVIGNIYENPELLTKDQ